VSFLPYNGLTQIIFMEKFLYNFSYQSYYWKQIFIAFKSWSFRMTKLTEDDLKNKVPENKLGVYSIYCDKSQWSRGDGIKNFWNSINEGYIDMTEEFFQGDT
jgi:hypothetical protein